MCLFAGQAAGADSAGDAIKQFGLVGAWSVDCRKTPMQTCDKNGCGSRTIYAVPPSGAPMITIKSGTLDSARGIVFLTTIHAAERIADDKIRILSTQENPSGVNVVWWRQPGELWETVLLKVGERYRLFSAHSVDGKKILAEDGFDVRPPPPAPPATAYDTLPTTWNRTSKQTPLFERCGDE